MHLFDWVLILIQIKNCMVRACLVRVRLVRAWKWFGLCPIDGTCKGALRLWVGARVDSSSVWNDFFVRTYFRTVYFKITYLLCLFSILFGSYVISTDIQKGMINFLLG